MSNTKDMSRGNPLKLMIAFTLPMLLSVSFQQLYNVADSVIAGQLLGENALAAVSASFPITMIFMSIGAGLSVGCSVVSSRLYGEKDFVRLKGAISTAFLLFTALAIVLTVAGFFATEPLLRLLSTPESVLADSVSYLQIYILGIFFIFIYNLCNSVFQSLGNSKIPLFFLIFSTLFNVALDIWFIVSFNMGVWGLSIATVIAQGIAGVLSLLVLVYVLTNLGKEKREKKNIDLSDKKGLVKFFTLVGVKIARFFVFLFYFAKTSLGSLFAYTFGRKPYKRLTLTTLKEILTVGIPSTIQMSTVSIGQLFIQNLVNSFGPTVMAGYGAAMKINTFCINIISTTGNALTIFVSQNIGAGREDRLRKGVKSASLMIAVITVVIVALAVVGADWLIGLFIDGSVSSAVVNIGKEILWIIVPFYALLSVKIVCDSALKGSSMMIGFTVSTTLDLIVRVALAYVLAYALGSHSGIWWSWPLGWLIGVIVSLFSMLFTWRKRYGKKALVTRQNI
ncbi:MAG: MATE family efflux transporter [Clostridia bacterium]|nr:MATE family efflux transporter [Clostridia bacterium]